MVAQKFPHLADELSDKLKGTVEDDLKFHAELALEAAKKSNNPLDKWDAYKQFVAWVSYCDKVKIEIINRDDVYAIMKSLWAGVKNSLLYTPRPPT
jgi:hypothetical protein